MLKTGPCADANRLRKTVILIAANPFASEWVVERRTPIVHSPVEVLSR